MTRHRPNSTNSDCSWLVATAQARPDGVTSPFTLLVSLPFAHPHRLADLGSLAPPRPARALLQVRLQGRPVPMPQLCQQPAAPAGRVCVLHPLNRLVLVYRCNCKPARAAADDICRK